MTINEEDYLVKNYTPNIDFRKQAIACNINYWKACHMVGSYFHHLYDFLDKHKMIAFTLEEKVEAIEHQKDVQAKILISSRDRMSEEAYEYNMGLIAEGKTDAIINNAKIDLLKKVIDTINFDEVVKLL